MGCQPDLPRDLYAPARTPLASLQDAHRSLNCSGGVTGSSLNHRLIASKPSASRITTENTDRRLQSAGHAFFYSYCQLSIGEFQSQLTSDRILSTPRWTRSQSRPPLSPGAAKRVAADMFYSLGPSSDGIVSEWKCESITLAPLIGDCWYYVVRFSEKGRALTGVPAYADIIVLMDGAAIQPLPYEDPVAPTSGAGGSPLSSPGLSVVETEMITRTTKPASKARSQQRVAGLCHRLLAI
jgi:hypothetical protein